jgi:hypothetical protein
MKEKGAKETMSRAPKHTSGTTDGPGKNRHHSLIYTNPLFMWCIAIGIFIATIAAVLIIMFIRNHLRSDEPTPVRLVDVMGRPNFFGEPATREIAAPENGEWETEQ